MATSNKGMMQAVLREAQYKMFEKLYDRKPLQGDEDAMTDIWLGLYKVWFEGRRTKDITPSPEPDSVETKVEVDLYLRDRRTMEQLIDSAKGLLDNAEDRDMDWWAKYEDWLLKYSDLYKVSADTSDI